MQRTFEIPFLARGRTIQPGADAIEFSGRSGARFRCPNPHRHIDDLVLADKRRLRDLHDMPVARIIDFLAELGPRLELERNPYMREAKELAVMAGGLTEPVLQSVFSRLPAAFDRTALELMLERTVGSAYLDGWVQQGTTPYRIRAIGTRTLHITAGNVPIVAAITLIRSALTKCDCLIKQPSNDPLTATAIVRTMIEMDPDHPVTKHCAVAYWKGGDTVMESEICRTSRIDKITAWGGMASMKHIQKYLVPGLDLIPMNPKLSIGIVGREALESKKTMKEAAYGAAMAAGRLNQTACVNARVVYVESDTDDTSMERVIELGEEIHRALQTLPSYVSTPAPKPDPELEAELRALDLEEELYWVKGNSVEGGVVVSRYPERVEFHERLNNRIVNLVPVKDLSQIAYWCDDGTQTAHIYPERLRKSMRDELGLAGVQWVVPFHLQPPRQACDDGTELPGNPHDGIEPMRRMVRWVVDESAVSEELVGEEISGSELSDSQGEKKRARRRAVG